MIALSINAEDRLTVHWTDEASLRDGLAEFARLYGWKVRTEVVLPGWGRVDLIAENRATQYVIEIKLRIDRPSLLRKAVQQLDGYARHLPLEPGMTRALVVMAPKIKCSAWEVEAAYPDISIINCNQLMTSLMKDEEGLEERLIRAERQTLAAMREFKRQRVAHKDLLALVALHPERAEVLSP